MIQVHLPEGHVVDVEEGTVLRQLLSLEREGLPHVVGALVDNEVTPLWRPLQRSCRVQWLTAASREGIRFVRRSLSLILVKAARDLFPQARLAVLHSLCKGFFCELHESGPLSREDVARLEAHMQEIIRRRLPFVPHEVTRERAMEIFGERGRDDLLRLFRHRSDEMLTLYALEDEIDFFHGDLAPDSGCMAPFELRFYPPGFIMRMPTDTSPEVVPPFVDTRKLGKVFYEFNQWSKVLAVPDVGALDEIITDGEINDFVRVAEALHEKRIAQIADTIDAARDRLRLVLIAGPSASGKTTFAQRLAVQLRVNGLKPIPISLDDYYVDRESTPLDEHGEYDFESVRALDCALLNEHLQRLTWGEPVRLPFYNFKTGKREYRKKTLQLQPGQLLVMEGIHALNEILTESIAKPNKFKIYVSALTQLNVDHHNRIPTTDTRLIRRITRDIQFRNINVRETLSRWRSVRRGEEENIFPFQEEADVMFNSGLFYELCVLRGIVEPLLEAVPRDVPEYTEARRLLSLLANFITVGTDEIPPNSILREFIGATCFFRAE